MPEELQNIPEQEQPEEGFVPYCAEAEMEANPKRKRGVRLLVIGTAVLVCFTVFLFVGKKHNFYQKTLRQLAFDYRYGESVDTDTEVQKGAAAIRLAERIQNHTVQLHANFYLLDAEGNESETISQYDLTHTPEADTLKTRTGSEGWFLTRSEQLSSANGDNMPHLSDYFFAVAGYGQTSISCYDSYMTAVGGKNYTCEIWLMAVTRGSATQYTTLYRYYDGATLRAVRVLHDEDDLMEIYDITNYSVQ